MGNWFKRAEEKEQEILSRFHYHTEAKVNESMEGLSYFLGNKHNPVLVVGDAPDNEDGTKNVLAVRLGVAEVIPASQVSDEEAAPAAPTVVNTGTETPDELDAQIAALEAKKESLAAEQPPQG